MIDSETIRKNGSDGPLILSQEVFRALGPLEKIGAQALEKVGKVQIVDSSEVGQVR